MTSCIGCDNFYYNNDGSGVYNTPYEEARHHANHIFHTNLIKFAEEYSDIKLYPWQKLALQWAMTSGRKYIIKKRK